MAVGRGSSKMVMYLNFEMNKRKKKPATVNSTPTDDKSATELTQVNISVKCPFSSPDKIPISSFAVVGQSIMIRCIMIPLKGSSSSTTDNEVVTAPKRPSSTEEQE